MSKVEELRQLARVIKNETAIGGNTAERVGSAFEGVADAIEGIVQINEMEKAVDAVKEKLNASKQAIEQAVAALPIAQEAGDSATKVMSQAAVTEYVNNNKKKRTYTNVAELQTNKEKVFDISVPQGNKIRLTVRGSNSVNLGIIYSDSARQTIANGEITDPSVYEFVLEKDMLQISLWTSSQTSITVEKEVMSPLLSEEDIAQTLSDTSSNKALGAAAYRMDKG